MHDKETFGSFFDENKKLVSDYLNNRLDIYRLRFIRTLSKTAGYMIWVTVSIILVSLFIIFGGLTTGFWLSSLTGSYARGFGITSLAILVVIFVLYMLRKNLFVDPIIRNVIKKSVKETNDAPVN